MASIVLCFVRKKISRGTGTAARGGWLCCAVRREVGLRCCSLFGDLHAVQAEKQSAAVRYTDDGKDDGKGNDVLRKDLHQCLVVHTRDSNHKTECINSCYM